MRPRRVNATGDVAEMITGASSRRQNVQGGQSILRSKNRVGGVLMHPGSIVDNGVDRTSVPGEPCPLMLFQAEPGAGDLSRQTRETDITFSKAEIVLNFPLTADS